MKIFLSWSGPRSKELAELFHSWLPSVLESAQPFFSPNIPKGSKGIADINDALLDCDFGIVIVTKQNAKAPWIQYESGMLASKGTRKVAVVILDKFVELDDLGPLGQFQFTKIDGDGKDLKKLLQTINDCSSCPIGAKKFEQQWDNWKGNFYDNWDLIREIPYSDSVSYLTSEEKLDKVLRDINGIGHDVSIVKEQARVTIGQINNQTELELEEYDRPMGGVHMRSVVVPRPDPMILPDGSRQYMGTFPYGAEFNTWKAYEIATGKSSYEYTSKEGGPSKPDAAEQ